MRAGARSAIRCGIVLVTGCLALCTLSVLAGCGKDSKPTAPGGGGGGSTSFTGQYFSGSEAGQISLTIATTSLAGGIPARRAGATAIEVVGTLSGLSNLSGTYDTATDSLHFSATDSLNNVYEFHGHVDTGSSPAGIVGTYSGPNGIGGWGALNGSTTDVKTYCGTYGGLNNASVPVQGVLTFFIREVFVNGGWNGRVIGLMVPDGGVKAYPFDGWAVEYEPPDPNTRVLALFGGEPGVYYSDVSGTISKANPENFSGFYYLADSLNEANTNYGSYAGQRCP